MTAGGACLRRTASLAAAARSVDGRLGTETVTDALMAGGCLSESARARLTRSSYHPAALPAGPVEVAP